jgi:hypothetical protein
LVGLTGPVWKRKDPLEIEPGGKFREDKTGSQTARPIKDLFYLTAEII